VPPAPPARTAADLLAAARVVRLALREPFRGVVGRELMLLPGPVGWGEFGPFVEYDTHAAVPWWQAAREAAVEGWPVPCRDRVPVNATVPAVPAAEVAGVLARFPGCTTAKVKVAQPGQPPAEDLDRLAATRDALGHSGHIRIDVNTGWDLDTALRLLPAYDRVAGGLQYAEQPCPSLADLATLRRRLDIPIAADESVRLAPDPLEVVRAEAADVVVVKVAPLGGVRPALRLAEQLGLPVVVSSAVDSSIGLAAGVALAATLPDLPYACGLGTAALLAQDVTDDPLLPVAGTVEVRPVTVSDARLAACAVPPERTEWWRRRLAGVMAAEAHRGEAA
jgi:o-succinylbenzoate synthase